MEKRLLLTLIPVLRPVKNLLSFYLSRIHGSFHKYFIHIVSADNSDRENLSTFYMHTEIEYSQPSLYLHTIQQQSLL